MPGFSKSIIKALAFAALLAPLIRATADDDEVGTSTSDFSRSAELLPDALAILQTADLADTKDRDTLKKLASKRGVCEHLAELLFPDTDRLIANLGADSFDIREAATQALSLMGEKIVPRVKPLLSSKDPEVKIRAKQILKAIKNGDIPDSDAMNNALFVVLNSKENPPSNTRPLQFYFEALPNLSKTLRDLLPAATERTANRPELANSIAGLIMENSLPELNNALFAALKKADPKRYPILSKKIDAWRAFTKMDLDTKAEDFNKTRSRNYADVVNMANTIETIPGYQLIKDETIKFLIASKHGFLVTAGITLAKDNAGPYADIIAKRLTAIRPNEYYHNGFVFINTPLAKIQNKQRYFTKYTDQLLDCQVTEIYKFALATIANPEKYKQRLIDDMLHAPNRCLIAFNFFHSRFPDEKQRLTTLIVNQIKKHDSFNGVVMLACALDSSGYDGHDFDKWLSDLADNTPEVIRNADTDTLSYFNPSPDVAIEKLFPSMGGTIDISEKFAYRLLKCSPKNKPAALKIILKSYKNTRNCGIYHPILPLLLLREKPNIYETVFNALIANYETRCQNDRNGMSYCVEKVISPFVRVIKTNPKARGYFEKTLDDEDPARRAIAAAILVQADPNNKNAADTIKKFILDGGEPTGLECLLWKLALELPAPPSESAVILENILKKPESKWKSLGSDYDSTFDMLNHNHAAAIPIILKTLKDPKLLSSAHKITLFNSLLQIDKTNPEVLKIFTKSILTPKKADDNLALGLLKKLNEKHIELVISQSRFDTIKDKNISAKFAVQAVKNTDKNIPAAMPALERALNEDALPECPTWFVMTKSDKLRQALLPLVSKAFLNDHLDSKNMLNIIKQFPDHLESIASKLLEAYKTATSPEVIDNLTYLAAFIPAESAKPFAEIAKKRYADAKFPEQKLLLHFLLARAAPDKTIRDENAKAFFALLGKNPVPEDWLGDAIVDSAKLNAYPTLLEKFLNKMLASESHLRQESAYLAILSLSPIPKFAENAIAGQVDKYAQHLKDPSTSSTVNPFPLMKTLRNQPELGLKFLDKLKTIPEEFYNIYDNEINKTIKFLEAEKAKSTETNLTK